MTILYYATGFIELSLNTFVFMQEMGLYVAIVVAVLIPSLFIDRFLTCPAVITEKELRIHTKKEEISMPWEKNTTI